MCNPTAVLEGCAEFLFTGNIFSFSAADTKKAHWWNSGYSEKIGCYLRFVSRRAFMNIKYQIFNTITFQYIFIFKWLVISTVLIDLR